MISKNSEKLTISKDTDLKKVRKAIKELEEADRACGDIWEDFGILIDDLMDMAKATSKNAFQKQKFDLLQTLKNVSKTVRYRVVYEK